MQIFRNKETKRVVLTGEYFFENGFLCGAGVVFSEYAQEKYEEVSVEDVPDFFECYRYNIKWEVVDTERLTLLATEKAIEDMKAQGELLEIGISNLIL